MEALLAPELWFGLATLSALEIVLGIDNLIFISLVCSRLPAKQRAKAKSIGIGLALGVRIALLLSLNWVMGLTAPLFSIASFSVSGRDLILILGGLFLLTKSTLEMHEKVQADTHPEVKRTATTFRAAIVQIILLDLVFSLDSVITAVGMSNSIGVMIAAVVIAMIFMLFAMNTVGTFIERNPTVMILALSFLLLIGMSLLGEGLHFHIPKGYIYFSMAFAFGIELINMRMRRRNKS